MRVRGNLLLVELLIVILFFSLSSVVTLEMFVAAREASAEAGTLNEALFLLEDIAERLAVSDDPPGDLRADGFIGDGYTLLRSEAGYDVTAEVSEEPLEGGVLWHVTLRASAGGEPVLCVRADRYVPEVRP